ncbi:MAG: LysM peptidoglycan-binding domain-containing protein [Chloroflexota bacterium]|nr:LysM peptidoglycan-binding domain-containing protein [Chloroflexota bacterium]
MNFMFNPFEYTITKSNDWQDKKPSGRNVPLVTFGQGGAQSLSLTLYFDSQLAKTDVRDYTKPLWSMMMIDQSKKNRKSNKGEPPTVAFEWGSLYFKSVITTISEKFSLFTDDGIPLRCIVQITLRQYEDAADVPPQTSGQSGNAPVVNTAQVREGDRLDHIAAENNGNPSDYRQIAETNNIDNPMRIPSGTVLRT